MTSPEPYLPAPRTYKDVPLVPAVDPEDLKRVWNVQPPWTAHSREDACSPGADVGAVMSRRHMIDHLVMFKLLGPWTHGEQLDDAVFRLAATFPLHEWQIMPPYRIPEDELFPFDGDAFLQRLTEETGIAHVWEPMPTKMGDGGRSYHMFFVHVEEARRDPEHEAVAKARQLLRMIWDRFSGVNEMVAPEEARAHVSNVWFEDFLVANTDVVEWVVQAFRQEPHAVGQDLLKEVEARVSLGMLE